MESDMPRIATEYIHSLGKFSGKPGLHRIKALCNAIGDPQKKLKFVHIAGTNGKGSTASMIASVLRHAGYKTGLYTSPYLMQFHERIRINGEMISEDDLWKLTEQVAKAAETLSLPAGETIGEFEFTTAVSFLYFAKKECDIVVLETGLGGRFDATNIIDAPEVCVLTPISYDHMAVLGNALPEIAAEKAAIIKAGSAVVCAVGQSVDVLSVIMSASEGIGAIWCNYPIETKVLRSDIMGSAFLYEGQGYTLSMPGSHQLQNAITALHTIHALQERGWKIDLFDTVHGLAAARMPGRLERVKDAPLILLDGAHNEAGVNTLCKTIDEMLKMRKMHIIMGMMRDKEYEICIEKIAKRADFFYAVMPDEDERALSANEIAKIAKEYCENTFDCEDIKAAIMNALEKAKPEDCILICGSLFLVGNAEKILKTRQKTSE